MTQTHDQTVSGDQGSPSVAPSARSGSGARQALRTAGGYESQRLMLKPRDEDDNSDTLRREIAQAARKGGDDDYVRDTITSAHLRLATPAQKAGMIVNLLDGYTGDADEAKILFILRADGRDATLAALKSMGHLQWLYDDMHGAEFDQLMALDSQEIRGKRIEDLLSRNVLDWVVSARECRRVLEILKSVSETERQALIQRIIGAGLLANFLKNVSSADKAAHRAIISGIPAEHRINVLLSYQVILDWIVTDGEAKEALDILLSVPAGQVDQVLSRVKLDKLLAELPDTERTRLAPLAAAATDPAIKAKLTAAKRHGETDAAYGRSRGATRGKTHKEVDARLDSTMAGYARDLAAAVTPADKAAVRARYAKAVGDADQALARKLALEKAWGFYLDAAPQNTLYTLVNLDRMGRILALIGSRARGKAASAADAVKARDELLAYPAAELHGFMPWVAVDRMTATLVGPERAKVQPLFDRATDAGQRASLFGALYKGDADSRRDAAGADITEKATIATSAATEIDNEIAIFSRGFEKARAKAGSDKAELAKVNRKYRAELDKLIARKKAELDLEFKYNVNITNAPLAGNAKDRVWSLGQLETIKSLFEKLPESHVKSNADVKEIRRERVAIRGGKEKTNIGGDHLGPLVRVYDTGLSGSYRYVGATSTLGEHQKGTKGAKGPLGALEEVLVHEIGHGVHDANPAAYAAFKGSADWTDHTKAGLKAKLQADGKSAAAADSFIKELDDNREKNYTQRPEKLYKGRVYIVDPYSAGYLSRTHGSIPSTQDTGSSAGTDSEFGYARSNPKDHFAEVYMQLAEVPETAYKNLVATPTARFVADDAEYKTRKREYDGLKAATPKNPRAIARAQRAMNQAKTKRDASEASMKALGKQWTVMRNDVYDADAAEVTATASLTRAANAVPDAVKKAKALGLVATFKKTVKQCGTPHQVEQLRKTVAAEIAAL